MDRYIEKRDAWKLIVILSWKELDILSGCTNSSVYTYIFGYINFFLDARHLYDPQCTNLSRTNTMIDSLKRYYCELEKLATHQPQNLSFFSFWINNRDMGSKSHKIKIDFIIEDYNFRLAFEAHALEDFTDK